MRRKFLPLISSEFPVVDEPSWCFPNKGVAENARVTQIKEGLDRQSLQKQLCLSSPMPLDSSVDDEAIDEEDVKVFGKIGFVPIEEIPDQDQNEFLDEILKTEEAIPELLGPEEQRMNEERRAIQDSLFPDEFMIVNEKDNLAIAWASVSINEGVILLGYDTLSCGFTALSSDCLTRNCVYFSTKRAPRYSLKKNNFFPVRRDNLSTLSRGRRERNSQGWLRFCLGKY